MNIDKGICCAVLAEQRLQPVFDSGIKPSHLFDPWNLILEKITGHFLQHNILPSKEVIFSEPDRQYEDPPDTLSYYIEEIRKRSLSGGLKNGIRKIVGLVEEDQPDTALSELQKMAVDLEMKGQVSNTGVVNLFSEDNLKSFIDKYNKRKAFGGPDGVLTPWPTFNAVSYGFQKQEVIVLVGKKKTRKTFVALAMLTCILKQNIRPLLLVSMEMSLAQMLQRLLAFNLKVPYDMLRKAKLPDNEEQIRLQQILAMKDSNGLIATDVTRVRTTYDLEILCAQIRPAFVFVDGLYILQARDKTLQTMHEKVGAVIKDLKQIAGKYDCIFLSTTQFNRKVKYGTTAATTDEIAACVSGDTIIYTEDGIKRIGECTNNSISVFDGEVFEPAKVVRAGKKRKCVVTFDDGSTVTCSPDHKFWVQSKTAQFQWKRAETLESNDACLVYGDYENGTSNIDASHDSNGRIKIDEPAVISPDLSECMGMLVGNGAVCQDNTWSLTLCGHDEDLASRFIDVIESEFGYKCKREPPDGHNRISIRMHSTNMIAFLTGLGMPRCRSHSKYIPSSVLSGTPVVRGAFLRGLFETDGSCTPRDLRFGSTSEQLAREVQILLRSLGIHSNMMKKCRKAGTEYWPMFYLRLPVSVWGKFKDQVGFVSERKRKILDEALSGNRHNMPNYVRPLNPHLSVITVSDVSMTDENIEMYDIVKRGGKHRFLANGIVAHNSDAIGQFADCCLAIFPGDKDEIYGPTAYLKTLAAREFPPVNLLIRYDLDAMDFSELMEVDDDDETFAPKQKKGFKNNKNKNDNIMPPPSDQSASDGASINI